MRLRPHAFRGPVQHFAEGASINITVIGRGNVGGGLARRSERAGHAVTEIGKDGGAATNVRDEGFEPLAHQVESIVGGPVAKSFNLNYGKGGRGRFFDRIAAPGEL
jgi:hypothetical protein